RLTEPEASHASGVVSGNREGLPIRLTEPEASHASGVVSGNREGLPIRLTEPEASHASGVVSGNRKRLLRGDRGQAVRIGLSRFLLPPRYCKDIPQGCIDRNCLLPPLLLLRASWPASLKQCRCSLKSCNGISIRIDPHRSLASTSVIGNGSPWKARVLIMCRNLSAGGIQVSCIHLLERLCDTSMEEALVRGTQGSTGQLSELVVAKVIGLSRSRALFSHYAPLP